MACLNNLGLLPSALIFYSIFSFTPLYLRTFTEKDLKDYRGKVVEMFRHAYESYLKNAFPFDELKPLSCNGIDTWGSFSLTLIDALDTLAVMQNYSEFRRVASQLVSTADFNININVSVFETNIRVVGGLLSAHLLSHKAGLELEPGWPCSGPLLNLAEAVARRLLPAFKTNTGMPYGTVNLRYGVPSGETPVTCTAGVSTFILEFGTLSRLTGDPVFEAVAQKAIDALWQRRSSLGLVGNHINVQEGKWTAMDAGIGGGIDSYYEYLLKGAIVFQDAKLMKMFVAYLELIEKHMQHDDWYFWVGMNSGQMSMPVFQSLESFWPGLLSLIGKTDQALKTLYNYHKVWKQYGFFPEFYDVSHGQVKREGYPLRPEFIESVMYLYRATKDPRLLDIGVDILESIDYSAWTNCGYATVKNVVDHRIEDRMESFFLAETTKYLYLLFDPNNFIHNNGSCGEIVRTTGGDCILGTGGYIFNTEAHPLDISGIYCCSKNRKNHGSTFQKTLETMNLRSLFNVNMDPHDIFQIFERDRRRRNGKHPESNKKSSKGGKKNPVNYSRLFSKSNVMELINTESVRKARTRNDEESSNGPSSLPVFESLAQGQRDFTKSFPVNIAKNIVNYGHVSEQITFDHQKVKSKYVASDPLKNSDQYLDISGIDQAQLELLSKRFEERHKIPVGQDFQQTSDTVNSEILDRSDMPVFDKSIDPSTRLSLSDSDMLPQSQEGADKPKNFYLKSHTKSIPLVPTIPLSNVDDVDLNVSSEMYELIAKHELLSCPTQPFIYRLNLMGEMMKNDL